MADIGHPFRADAYDKNSPRPAGTRIAQENRRAVPNCYSKHFVTGKGDTAKI